VANIPITVNYGGEKTAITRNFRWKSKESCY